MMLLTNTFLILLVGGVPPRLRMEYRQLIGFQALHKISTDYSHFSELFAPFVLPSTTAALWLPLYLVWTITFSKLLRTILVVCYPDFL